MMRQRTYRICLVAACLVAGTTFFLHAFDQPQPTGPKTQPSGESNPVGVVVRGPFSIEAVVKGVFEAPEMTEIALRPAAWLPITGGAPLTVLKAVAPGTPVKKGDWLLSIDPTALDRAIRDLEADQKLAEATVTQTEKDLAILEKSVPQDIRAAERAKLNADEDLKLFLGGEKALAQKSAHVELQMYQFQLEYARDNLRQLEKMYRDKDLTEETEQIILKRERRRLEDTTFRLEQATKRQEKTLQVELPRKEADLHEAAAKGALALEKATSTLPVALAQKRQALVKARYDHDKSVDKLKKLKLDRQAMAVTAPADGLVYYGRCIQGQWITAAEMARKLHRGGIVAPEEVFITIVRPGPLFVRATVDEKDLPVVSAGAKARISALAAPGRKMWAKVDQVSAVPLSPGTFEARLAIRADGIDAFMPGMTCTATVVAYRKMDALTVPTAAVFDDDADDDKSCVYVSVPGTKPEKRAVEPGRRSADRVEIRSGVKVGEQLLLSRPTGS